MLTSRTLYFLLASFWLLAAGVDAQACSFQQAEYIWDSTTVTFNSLPSGYVFSISISSPDGDYWTATSSCQWYTATSSCNNYSPETCNVQNEVAQYISQLTGDSGAVGFACPAAGSFSITITNNNLFEHADVNIAYTVSAPGYSCTIQDNSVTFNIIGATCSQQLSCGDCLEVDNCGWSSEYGTCTVADYSGASDFCPCSSYSACSPCFAAGNCQWCMDGGGSCVDAGSQCNELSDSGCCRLNSQCNACFAQYGCAWGLSSGYCQLSSTCSDPDTGCCSGITTCTACNGQDGCSWCDGGTPTCTQTALCSTPVSPCCSTFANCSSCSTDPDCEWCNTGSTCGPTGTCGQSQQTSCCLITSCEQCNEQDGCQWCLESGVSTCISSSTYCTNPELTCCFSVGDCESCQAAGCQWCDNTCQAACINPSLSCATVIPGTNNLGIGLGIGGLLVVAVAVAVFMGVRHHRRRRLANLETVMEPFLTQ